MSSYEENNPADITIDELFPTVQKYLKEITKEQINFIYHGTYNVFDINSQFMLRVPDIEFRNFEGLNLIRSENKILSFLKDKLPLKIPSILYINGSEDLPFIITKKIPGISLSNILSEISDEKKIKIAKKIGEFLNVLHSEALLQSYYKFFSKSLPMNTFANLPKTLKQEWGLRFDKIQKLIFPILNLEQQNWLKKVFSDYLTNKENFIFEARLNHSDFDTSNILINPETLELTGIIDFETCRVYDPAYDLLFHDEGSKFHNAILSVYCQDTGKSLVDRMKFFYCRTCIEYMQWGLEHDRSSLVEAGFRLMTKNMKMFPE
ncbi:MAG TPA: aminoglycoside phosphotransferase family protein [Candidatus Bathyarchaeia archaeon]|nr:aminoglycoside phosphotransferase family protein [Candidatus Bathyarchaeia archaeon]